MSRAKLDLWVGVFVLIGIGAVLFLSLNVASRAGGGFSDTYVLWAEFSNIGGLKARAPVKSAGVVVGRVSRISFDTQKYLAKVELAIGSDFPFPDDTSAAILTSGLLGEQYIGLDPGGSEDMLKQDKQLTRQNQLTMVQPAIVLENLIGQFLFSKAAESPSK